MSIPIQDEGNPLSEALQEVPSGCCYESPTPLCDPICSDSYTFAYPESSMTVVDRELTVMSACWAQLSGLDEVTRVRVVNWLRARVENAVR